MKRKLIAGLLVVTMIAGTFAFAGCDTIAPVGGNTADNNQGSDGNGSQGSQSSGSQGNDSSNVAWEKDDDYHWHTEADKALHTVENGVCTACGKEVTHTIGLEYTLVTARTRSVDSSATYKVSGIGSATETDLVIPETYNNIPVTEIGEGAFENTDVESIAIPVNITVISAGAFDGCDAFASVYYWGNLEDWGHVHISSDNRGFMHAIVYTYVKGSPADPGYYWGYDNDYKIVPYIWWQGANGLCGEPMTLFWTETRPTKFIVDYKGNLKEVEETEDQDFMMTQGLECTILSVDGDNVRFTITETFLGQFIPEYFEEVDSETGDTIVYNGWREYYWSGIGNKPDEAYAFREKIVGSTIEWGEPKDCVDSKGNSYYGFVVKNDVYGWHYETKAEITYYVEVNSVNVYERGISISLHIRDMELGDFYMGNRPSSSLLDVDHYCLWTWVEEGNYHAFGGYSLWVSL